MGIGLDIRPRKTSASVYCGLKKAKAFNDLSHAHEALTGMPRARRLQSRTGSAGVNPHRIARYARNRAAHQEAQAQFSAADKTPVTSAP